MMKASHNEEFPLSWVDDNSSYNPSLEGMANYRDSLSSILASATKAPKVTRETVAKKPKSIKQKGTSKKKKAAEIKVKERMPCLRDSKSKPAHEVMAFIYRIGFMLMLCTM